MKVLVTGSCGLIGSEAVIHYASRGHEVSGIDNNLRRYFFGPQGDTTGVLAVLKEKFPKVRHHATDIRDREAVFALMKELKPDLVVHTAAQPSHDWAAKEPFTDFEVNAVGSLNMLEAFRQHAPEGVFILMSTNKVYGDRPNTLPLKEQEKRWEYADEHFKKGISEELSIDRSLHSLFGASKVAADVLCQEYGRYFGLKTGAFRGGCLTGSRHAAVELHGFLSYLVNCAVAKTPYKVFGYKGKQVRDQIHSSDVLQMIDLFVQKPRPGEVYNLGGGYENSASILELVDILKKDFKLSLSYEMTDAARKGDHICYYSDLSKFKSHYPSFKLKMSLHAIIEDMLSSR